MQKHNYIKAFFFLGIFSLLLLHQVVPHLHHQYVVEHEHKVVSHSDTHSHHHDAPENESSKKGFLDLFLEAHVHTVVSNDILVTRQSILKKGKVKKDVNTPISVNHYSTSVNFNEAEKATAYHPPNTHFTRYHLSSLSLRGPPSLG